MPGLLPLTVILISIHAPRVGSDFRFYSLAILSPTFQSTLPVWGATLQDNTVVPVGEFQSTLPVWGATIYILPIRTYMEISIHAPRVGSDDKTANLAYDKIISIHAPRVGSDASGSQTKTDKSNFNPRSPCGERHFPVKR